MVEERANEGYRQVSLPSGLYRKIQEQIANSNGDFTSVADYVKYAVRKAIEANDMRKQEATA